MKKHRFDVLVIGGGPGGYVAAIRAASSGKKTALVERENLGGVCLNWGCIPTKSLLRNAEILHSIKEAGTFGVAVSDVRADYQKAQERSRAVSQKLVKGIEFLMKKNQITVFHDNAAFIGKKEVCLEKSKDSIAADNIIIAAGARPMALSIADYTKPNILDSKKALQLKEAPKSIVIIGAGAIGMEFATVFRAYGAEVIIVEMMDRVLPNEDSEISALMEKEYKKSGIEIFTGTKVLATKSDGKTVLATIEQKGKRTELKAQYLLCATGITPNTEGLQLEKSGVKVDQRGYIKTDDEMKTNVNGVYAIGDITGKLALAHTASAQGLFVVDAILGKKPKPLSYENMPKCTYTSLECASAGLTEQKAKEKKYDTGVAVFPLSANGKALSYGQTAGMVKLVYDKKYGQVLGMHMAGIHVTEMIWGMVGYLGVEMTIEEMANVVHPHPTVSEAIMEAAHLAEGKAIHI